ncbi:NAD(P)-dependent oxidoreductase [Pigmentibacter sp. JX0631]|uniref:NAD-dependent epimerase/dehydratase family protein n=1 Tax=Pigmentibacter sp. JX0631 TaxID=2976982 RepID=UPI002469317D|nr:NAD(P)-dependent oxidoreductase [Pigmentibacter sp. JX0631]WGL60830.1 NAD(P)-dependent oxidoreductase [Pigmentibacter sp. JX0631]
MTMNRNQEPTVLLTGATGFLGSRLLPELLENNFSVIVLHRESSDLTKLELFNCNKLKFFCINKDDLDFLFKNYNINVIIHTATEYGRNFASTSDVILANLTLPLRLLELGVMNNLKIFINTDSYFNKDNAFYSYLLNYSLTKKSLNYWLKFYSSKIRVIDLMLEHIYGPFDKPQKFIEGVIQNIAIKELPIVNLTYGHQKRDFIFITDVVDAYLKILKYELRNHNGYQIYEVGTGKAFELREFTDFVLKYSKSSSKLEYGAIPYREDEIMSSCANNSNLEALGWKAKINYQQGIEEIINIYRNKLK